MNFFFLKNRRTTEISTLPLHDALPSCSSTEPAPTGRPDRGPTAVAPPRPGAGLADAGSQRGRGCRGRTSGGRPRSEEHTSELQSRQYLVCRLLLEKKHSLLTSQHLLVL